MARKPAFADEESQWEALLRRDRNAEGAFYYAVKTTGVFCRPGCASRLPKRENVLFFRTCGEAELAGYRPCKRCKPSTTSPDDRTVELVVKVCRHIEEAETPPTLNQLAAEVGLSPWHLHRLFKDTVGVTPKQYAATQQAQRFRDSLKMEGTITAAIYDAGFSSNSRAYGNARERLAMTPSTYRKGAPGLTIRYGIASCFLGWVIVAQTDRGICAIEFGDDPGALPERVRQNFWQAKLEEAGSDFSAVIEQVVAFLEAPGSGVRLPLDIQGTVFQERVWNALRLVPPGSTVSYADIADLIGSPKAVRAVAQACAANRLAVAVPCHRVVRSDGKLSGYRWGVERKRTLLLRESGLPGELNAGNEDSHED